MRIVFISDTHLHHDRLEVPPGDILVHAGDFSGRGRLEEVKAFLDWYGSLPHTHKVLIAGNHDFLAEREPRLFRSLIPDNLIYLEDSGVTIEGIRIWGSPIQPWFFDWAFNRQRGADIRQHWALIPDDTDILVTHGPPYGILDRVARDGSPVGCRDLLRRINDIDIKINVFGHIHEAYGQQSVGNTLFLNAAVLDENYILCHKPWVVDWGGRTSRG